MSKLISTITFVFLLVAGIAFTIAGIWVTPLYGVGAGLITAALAMLAKAKGTWGSSSQDGNKEGGLEMVPPKESRPPNKRTLRFSAYSSGRDLKGKHYSVQITEQIEVTKEESPTSSEKYVTTADDSEHASTSNQLRLV